jgi:hypothetical protein
MNLTQLVEFAGEHAQRVLIGLNKPLVPAWVMVDAKGKVEIVGTPWRNDIEKTIMVAAMRLGMRKNGIVAYSLVVEAWAASAPPGWKEGDPHVPPAEDPKRREIVVALATDGKETVWRQWVMHRDYNEQVVKLEPEPMKAEQATSWMAGLLNRGTPQS